ncbi:hypothetical protein BDZ97DRAFT_1100892 [Flammula alnicola]|nr:hypothetical protein BDZ97DRAFT_1100892 [Flammula alnicola]
MHHSNRLCKNLSFLFLLFSLYPNIFFNDNFPIKRHIIILSLCLTVLPYIRLCNSYPIMDRRRRNDNMQSSCYEYTRKLVILVIFALLHNCVTISNIR